MDAAVRTYGTAGLALVTAGVIAVTPVTPPPDLHVVTADVRLTSTGAEAVTALWDNLNYFDWSTLLEPGTWKNIVDNLFIDILNIPWNWWQAVNTYATAGLGPPGVVGVNDVPTGYDPQHPNPVLTGTPDSPAENPYYAPVGEGHSMVPIGIGGTGSWWMESTGNTWGWDEGNFGQVLGISNMLVPIPQFSSPFAYSLQAFAMQQMVANPQACPFECPDILGYLGRWFHVPLADSVTGTTVGLNDPTDPTSAIDPMGTPISWAGQTVQYDPFFFITSFLKSLTMDPTTSGNTIADYGQWFTDPGSFFQPFWQDIKDLLNDFNPFVDGSFLYWGAPAMYTLPSLLAGLVSSFTGIANPMAPYTLAPGGGYLLEPYATEPAMGGTGTNGALVPEGLTLPSSDQLADGNVVTLANLLPGLAAGFLNLVGGMLGYLEPDTYLHAFDTTSAEVAHWLATADFAWLGNILTGWQDGVAGLVSQLAQWSDDLIPWYAPLTVGMEDLLPTP
ncbi:MAG TPA: hypothetical protein VFQ37_17815 [Mycobacterium sp.]|nr:hypothetical protein [Mycobacterium sp.]